MGFFGVKKRHPYPSGRRSYGAKAIIDIENIHKWLCIFLAPELKDVVRGYFSCSTRMLEWRGKTP
jgi:hypothetical protein